ncbi:YitT family protein [Candidatus Enterococcus palustris]|uniref:YitT family protein n=1 Tax=Candidatus Enterococcus palustris TaxID=1834189 RepID=UPI000A35B386|nr:YitT family protein [Enterococcus sp. 7F3_DIV0205]
MAAYKILVALAYAFLSSLALNFFWLPGNIYANGITGLSQLISTVLKTTQGGTISIPLLVLVFNLPLLVVSWFKIDREFTVYTIFAVFMTALFMRMIPVVPLTTDPVICAVFGGVLHGISVGITLKSDFSTGGLDIIGIVVRKATGKSIGTVFIIFNLCVQFAAGFLYGWQFAFYSALSVFISGRMVDYVNTKQQKVQVMIVTNQAEYVIGRLHQTLKRGITVINDVEGAFDHQQKKLLVVVVAKKELKQLNEAVNEADAGAFVSVSSGVSTNTAFYEW